jgi:hypothetical protein
MVQEMKSTKRASEIFSELNITNSIEEQTKKEKDQNGLKAPELLNPSEHFYMFVNGMTTSTSIYVTLSSFQ